MTSLTTTLRQTKPATIGWVFGFALALTAAAQITIPLPGTPVPFTLQPLVVVLAGLMLGPVAGAASMVLYLAAGAIGLPVFSPVGAPGILRFIGPTGGYLVAYPVAGIAMIFVGGIAHLTVYSGSMVQAVRLGITPFFLLDIVKALIAAAVSGSKTRKSLP